MKKVIKIRIASVLLLAGTIVSSVSSVYAAKFQPVYSFKNLGEFNNPQGQEFTKLLVTCNGDPKPRYIQRIVGQNLWCIDGNAESCSKERIDTATIACTTEAPSAVATIAAPTPEQLAEEKRKAELRDKLLAEQLEVEQKRIDIQARRVELQALELRLAAQKTQE